MDVVLNIPDPKFKNGQVVRLQNDRNTHGIYLLILKREGLGDFWVTNDIVSTIFDRDYYYASVQANSVANREGSEFLIIRPGKFLTLNRLVVEERGQVVKWAEPIITPDTANNIQERTDKWDDALGAWKEPLSAAAL